MTLEIATIFPELFEQFVRTSIVGRAISKGLATIGVHNLREFTDDVHRTVDDYPYGGGPGMVMRVEPFKRCLDAIRSTGARPHVVHLSPRGELFTHRVAQELVSHGRLVLLCGHYKGVDERVARLSDREISIGDYVLSGGEVPAMVVTDACVRLIPGVVGDFDSVQQDSHYGVLLSAPEYTRPEEFDGMKVPSVLLSGDHEKIRQWRRERSLEVTRERRPDLFRRHLELLGELESAGSEKTGAGGREQS
ncbi:MAG: tRNA (guanosine(37)-N1)-methyltransferase TrmD [Candidatus Riflebacteria bacterium]|nr:tRNA (guanosine(37)-N1)-methyltransferase TrmD [Candidatus Riflebacteria bacterium]